MSFWETRGCPKTKLLGFVWTIFQTILADKLWCEIYLINQVKGATSQHCVAAARCFHISAYFDRIGRKRKASDVGSSAASRSWKTRKCQELENDLWQLDIFGVGGQWCDHIQSAGEQDSDRYYSKKKNPDDVDALQSPLALP
jgi:hypothetical protein